MPVTYEMMIHDRLQVAGLSGPLYFFDDVSSTNDIAKERILSHPIHGAAVVATRQSAGRGTYGRSFLSETGGIYLSLMINSCDWHFKARQLATIFVAVAVKSAIDDVLGIQVDLKWVNDLFLKGRKVGGILTEQQVGSDWLVIGIGLNVSPLPNGFPDELKQIATTLGMDDFDHGIKANLIATIMKKMLQPSELSDQETVLKQYQAGLFILNRYVFIVDQKEEFEVLVQGVDPLGRLIVRKACGEVLHLQAGDVRLKQKEV
ncbi:MAG: biotin--[acetyl-CoA-carboxylase] ligase [Defluviitaleaceae bacterium]|nr:biotin--[acetyl-CoA-carboxylase] ligase [Defluviitaleaceae bacterium]